MTKGDVKEQLATLTREGWLEVGGALRIAIADLEGALARVGDASETCEAKLAVLDGVCDAQASIEVALTYIHRIDGARELADSVGPEVTHGDYA